jgi:hypothetical protein
MEDQRKITNTKDMYTNLFISVLLNAMIILFPFIISIVYREKILTKTATISVAMFLMSIAIGTSVKLIFYTFLIIAFILVATYGAISNNEFITNLWNYQSWLAILGMLALCYDKYVSHVDKGQPLHNF